MLCRSALVISAHDACSGVSPKRLGLLAVLVAHESAEPSSQPVLLGLVSAANGRTDSSNPILNPKGSIH